MLPALLLTRHAETEAIGAHFGLNSDSSSSIRLILISRLARTRDEALADRMAASPICVAFLLAIRSLVQRIGVRLEGVSPLLSESNVQNLLNLPGSASKYESQYGQQIGTLQSRLPWSKFRKLTSALLNAVTAARQTTVGAQLAHQVLSSTPATAVDLATSSILEQFVAAVDSAMRKGLAADLDAASRSRPSSAHPSERTTPLPSPATIPPPASTAFAAAAQTRHFTIDPNSSLLHNLLDFVQRRLGRALEPSEAAAMTSALDEGLSVLQSGTANARQQLLQRNVLSALGDSGAAMLWAATLESLDYESRNVAAIARVVLSVCSDVASTLFASATSAVLS